MKLDSYLQLNEVIPKEQFEKAFECFLDEVKFYSADEQLEILEILSEKYSKFHNTLILNKNQKEFLFELMVKLTNFNDIGNIQDLGYVLIGFDLDDYYLYLKHEYENREFKNEIKEHLLDLFSVFESKSKKIQ